MNILIYSDNVSNNHVLYYSLSKLRGKQGIYFVNANEILAGALDADVDLLVMPGGASRYKSAKLDGRGNQLIKEYVQRGGRYMGICAGAYMACDTTHWAKGEPFEIVTQNELGFFNGIAKGPVEAFGRGDNYNQTKPRVVELQMSSTELTHTASLYIGGCYFAPSDDSDEKSDYQVLARFAELPDKPAAIVYGEYGHGRWLLCSSHPEYDREALELLDFDVVGNDYQAYSQVDKQRLPDLSLLDHLLKTLER
ncbi:BPL-N domain-containing protein [Vibrio sp. WXL103]|uniref:BPL-N domain-containing protein n=1 Tax=unclassified Vibrio TaxID=2614977 RepID=UPI003EC903EB